MLKRRNLRILHVLGAIVVGAGAASLASRADPLPTLSQVTDSCASAALNGASTLAVIANGAEKAGYTFSGFTIEPLEAADTSLGATNIYLVEYSSTLDPPHAPLRFRVQMLCPVGGGQTLLAMTRS